MEIPKNLHEKLEKLAFKKSKPFCYNCYYVVQPNEKGHAVCSTCFSDDLMRLVEGVGCEYGLDWVIEHLIEEHLIPTDVDEYYDEWMAEIYSSTVKICGVEFDQSWAFKELDPIAYDLGKSEMISFNLGDEIWVEISGEYYNAAEVETFCGD